MALPMVTNTAAPLLEMSTGSRRHWELPALWTRRPTSAGESICTGIHGEQGSFSGRTRHDVSAASVHGFCHCAQIAVSDVPHARRVDCAREVAASGHLACKATSQSGGVFPRHALGPCMPLVTDNECRFSSGGASPSCCTAISGHCSWQGVQQARDSGPCREPAPM